MFTGARGPGGNANRALGLNGGFRSCVTGARALGGNASRGTMLNGALVSEDCRAREFVRIKAIMNGVAQLLWVVRRARGLGACARSVLMSPLASEPLKSLLQVR